MLPGVPVPRGSLLFTYQEQEGKVLHGQSHLSMSNTSHLIALVALDVDNNAYDCSL